MKKTDAIKLLKAALAKIKRLRSQHPNSPDHIAFIQSTGLDLEQIFGSESVIGQNFARINYFFIGSILTNPWSFEKDKAMKNQEAYLAGLDQAEGILVSALEQLEKFGLVKSHQNQKEKKREKRVFISHGVQTQALSKVENFIRSMGLIPVVVIREASEGMSVDDLVEKKMGESDCAIILATSDESIGGRKQPRPNVIHEIGLAQVKFQNKVIYLKEEDCEFPSNVRPKIWENFTQENMELAFGKIVKELSAFGLIN